MRDEEGLPGLLFDLDGVLINSSQFHWRAWRRLGKEEAGFAMDYEGFLRSFGKRNEEILLGINTAWNEEERGRLAQRKEQFFREEIDGQVELLDGVEEFLKEVCERGIPHIIASSTPPDNLDFFLSNTVLGNYFNSYISGDEVAEGKPAPDVFLEAAERLGRKPVECIVFEDSPAGLKAAASAGSFVVALATTHSSDQLDPYDMVVPSLGQLSLDRLIERWSATIPSAERSGNGAPQ